MLQILKLKGAPRKKGEQFVCYFGREQHHEGEVAEVVDGDGQTVNIVQVAKSEVKDGDIYLTFKVIA